MNCIEAPGILGRVWTNCIARQSVDARGRTETVVDEKRRLLPGVRMPIHVRSTAFTCVLVVVPGIGAARLAPGYPYPRSAGEPQVADHPIRLTDGRRRRIAENFDPDAVEQIANLLPVEERRHFLRSFGGVPGEAPAPATREQQDFAVLVRHSDPKIEALIEQMWTPWWDHEPAAALDDPNYNFPGKELAKKRRLM